MEASVILSKCSVQNQLFGIRVEKRNDDWVRTWTFKIDASKAKREGFDKTVITGSFYATPEYPGCPYCGNGNSFFCSCGKVSCCAPKIESITCHWCNNFLDDIIYGNSYNVSSDEY